MSYYFSADLNNVYNYLIDKAQRLLLGHEKLKDDNPLLLDEIIDNLSVYIKLSKRDYTKIVKAKTADEYDFVIRKIKLRD